MKRIVIICVLPAFLLVSTIAWVLSKDNIANVLDAYEKAFDIGVPSDLKLTIYYMDPTRLTRVPVRTLEDLTRYSDAQIITVGAEELAAHSDLLKKLNVTCLQSIGEGTNTNSIIGYLRLVYIFERGNGEMLLEVMASSLIYDDSVWVNGVEVKNMPIFYELIDPFLTEVDRTILTRTFEEKLNQ